MKNKLIEILKGSETDENKAKAIIELAVPDDTLNADHADELGERLVAFRKVIGVLGKCESPEISISPTLLFLLCSEMEYRAQGFARAETAVVIGGSRPVLSSLDN